MQRFLQVLPSVLILATAGCGFTLVQKRGCELALWWTAALPHAQGAICRESSTRERHAEGSSKSSDRVGSLLHESAARQQHHLSIGLYYSATQYASIGVGFAAAILLAALLAHAGKDGWSSAPPALAFAILVAAGLSTFFPAFPAVFQHAENAAQNFRLYDELTSFESHLRNRLAYASDEEIEALVAESESKLAALRSIGVRFDVTAIPATLRGE